RAVGQLPKGWIEPDLKSEHNNSFGRTNSRKSWERVNLEVTAQTNITTPGGACTKNTITTTASTNISILAIDLGKYKSVAGVHDQPRGEEGGRGYGAKVGGVFVSA